MKKTSKNILFSILGTSPQILTETIFALTQSSPAFVPDKIVVLTTGVGADQCTKGLFGANGGWFKKLCEEYELQGIEFNPDLILSTVRADGSVIDDIRSPEDNQTVANHISELIREFTSDENVNLHVSIAGGRKTMGFYAGYALSMFGRKQDQLSHVLVQEQFEGEPKFYYPTKNSEVFSSSRNPEKYFDKKDAKVELAYLPFVRMRAAISGSYVDGIVDFDDMVHLLQREINPDQTPISFDKEKFVVRIGSVDIKLSPMNFLFYFWAAKKLKQNKPIIRAYKENSPEAFQNSGEFYEVVDDLYTEHSARHTDLVEKLDEKFGKGMKQRFIDERRTEIKEEFEKYLGVNAERYTVEKLNGTKGVGLSFKPSQLRVSRGCLTSKKSRNG